MDSLYTTPAPPAPCAASKRLEAACTVKPSPLPVHAASCRVGPVPYTRHLAASVNAAVLSGNGRCEWTISARMDSLSAVPAPPTPCAASKRLEAACTGRSSPRPVHAASCRVGQCGGSLSRRSLRMDNLCADGLAIYHTCAASALRRFKAARSRLYRKRPPRPVHAASCRVGQCDGSLWLRSLRMDDLYADGLAKRRTCAASKRLEAACTGVGQCDGSLSWPPLRPPSPRRRAS
jgi:hypothetical protein